MNKLIKLIIIILIIILFNLVMRFTINLIVYKTNNQYINNFLYIINLNNPYIVYYNQGNIFYKNKNYKKAIKYYKKALTQKPNNKNKKIIKEMNAKSTKKLSEQKKDKIVTIKKTSTESNNEQLIIDNNDAERIRRKELQLYKNLEQYKHYTRNN